MKLYEFMSLDYDPDDLYLGVSIPNDVPYTKTTIVDGTLKYLADYEIDCNTPLGVRNSFFYYLSNDGFIRCVTIEGDSKDPLNQKIPDGCSASDVKSIYFLDDSGYVLNTKDGKSYVYLVPSWVPLEAAGIAGYEVLFLDMTSGLLYCAKGGKLYAGTLSEPTTLDELKIDGYKGAFTVFYEFGTIKFFIYTSSYIYLLDATDHTLKPVIPLSSGEEPILPIITSMFPIHSGDKVRILLYSDSLPSEYTFENGLNGKHYSFMDVHAVTLGRYTIDRAEVLHAEGHIASSIDIEFQKGGANSYVLVPTDPTGWELNGTPYQYGDSLAISVPEPDPDNVQMINILTDGSATKYHIRFLDWNGNVLDETDVNDGSTPVYSGSAPIRDGYEFIGWNPAPYPADKDQDYTASYRLMQAIHTLSFQDSAGKDIIVRPPSNTFTDAITEIWFNDVLDTIIFRYKDRDGTHFCYINYSDLPSVELNAIVINGERYDHLATPYTLDITDDATFILDTTNRYLIRFLDWDGTVLQSGKVSSGTIPEYTGQEPTRTGYDFAGWTPELSAVTKDQDYTASYDVSQYSVRFLDGTEVLQSSEVRYGTVPEFSGNLPTKEGQAFVGWNPTPYPADKDQDYVAKWAYQEAIVLYNCTCEDDRVDKSGYLTQIVSVDGVFREDTDMLHPSVAIDCASFDPSKANYAWIGGFGRWYYIRRSRFERSPKGTVRRFEMDVDVLMSHKDAILANGAVIDRQETTYDDNLVDPLLPVRVGNTVESYVVPNTTMASYDEKSDDEYDTVIVVNAANTQLS